MTMLVTPALLMLPGQPAAAGPSPKSPFRPAIEPFGYRGVRIDEGAAGPAVQRARAR